MPDFGFLATLEARPGQEGQVVEFLRAAELHVHAEPGTLMWFAFQSGPNTFHIFDVFDTEAARQTHLRGKVGEELEARGSGQLLDVPPIITPVDLIAAKIPPMVSNQRHR